MTGDEALFCTFEAAGRLFGVPIEDIKEVTAEVHCTSIPHSPVCVRGYVNIRGQIILALDLQRLLQLQQDGEREAKRLVIFKQVIGPAFGLLVDEIGEIAKVSKSDFAANQSVHAGLPVHGPNGLVDRVCRLEKQLLVVLNPRKFLPFIENELSRKSSI
jgi:purine-binding chemotaxis protein CheW